MIPKKYSEVIRKQNLLGKELAKNTKIIIIISTIVGILALIICLKSLELTVNYEALKRENEELNKVIEMKDSIIGDLQEDNKGLQKLIDGGN